MDTLIVHSAEIGSAWIPWWQAAGVVALGFTGCVAGRWCARLPSGWWLSGYLIPLVALLLCGAALRYPALELKWPFSWLTAGRREYPVLAFAAAWLFGTLLPRLRAVRQRALVGALVAVIVLVEAAWPFLAPAFNRDQLRSLKTTFDADGICIQNTDFTCGPAAAVTALRALGWVAEEGELAELFGTTASTGSPADVVADRLNVRFGPEGLRAVHQACRTAADLRGHTPALAWVRFAWLTDHVVAVLEVTPDRVVLGDPFRGRRVLTPPEFEQQWRRIAVTLQRQSASPVWQTRAGPSG